MMARFKKKPQTRSFKLFNQYVASRQELHESILRAGRVLADCQLKLRQLYQTCPLCASSNIPDLLEHFVRRHQAVRQSGWLKCPYCEALAGSIDDVLAHCKVAHSMLKKQVLAKK